MGGKKFWRIGPLGFALLIAILIVIYLIIPKEPRYQGRTLSSWLGQVKSASDGSLENEQKLSAAQDAVKHIGTNALPWLLKWALAKDSKLIAEMSAWLDAHPRMRLHISSANERCWNATIGFRVLGDQAEAVAPILNQWTHDRDPERRIRGYFYLVFGCHVYTGDKDTSERMHEDADPIVQNWFFNLWAHRFYNSYRWELFPDNSAVTVNTNLFGTNPSPPSK